MRRPTITPMLKSFISAPPLPTREFLWPRFTELSKLFEESGILEKHDFGDGRARYETADREHHDHLIDLQSGEVIEFIDAEIEALQERIADKLGYELKGHRLELYGVPKKAST